MKCGQIYDLDQTSPIIATYNVGCPDKVCKWYNILPEIVLDQMLNQMLDRCTGLQMTALLRLYRELVGKSIEELPSVFIQYAYIAVCFLSRCDYLVCGEFGTYGKLQNEAGMVAAMFFKQTGVSSNRFLELIVQIKIGISEQVLINLNFYIFNEIVA